MLHTLLVNGVAASRVWHARGLLSERRELHVGTLWCIRNAVHSHHRGAPCVAQTDDALHLWRHGSLYVACGVSVLVV